MIDTHCHLLPGVDDGAEDEREALAMARCAEADGISVIVVTPHVRTPAELAPAASIAAAVARLGERLSAAGVALRLVPGAEVAATALTNLEQAPMSSLTVGRGGSYLLLEPPPLELPCGFSRLLYEVRLRGFIPILAHPERVAVIADDPGCLEGEVRRGLLLQVTAGSVTGLFGDAVRRAAFSLIRQGWVQLLASDAHGERGRRPVLSPAVDKLRRRLAPSEIDALVAGNGARLLRGEALPHGTQPYRPARRFWFFRVK